MELEKRAKENKLEKGKLLVIEQEIVNQMINTVMRN